jgi:replicative DNA helicase
VETRKESKIPVLADLRESGAIEQDADMVIFIYRPESHEILHNEQGESTKGEAYIKIAKHRNGALDMVKLKARLDIQKFEEWDGDDGFKGFNGGGNWKPVNPQPTGGNITGNENGGKLFIQKGSRMNSGEFDEGFDMNDPV